MAAPERGHHRNVPGYADSFWFKYVLSVIAAGVAETVTYPLDLTKTRLQIQGELSKQTKQKVPYRGMLQTALGVVYSGCRMGAYEWIRDNVLGREPDGSFPVWKAVCGGLVAGSLGQFIASPTDLVKVQMQMEGRRILEGKPARVRGTWHAFTKILAEGGIRGLWKGWVPNVQRAALVNMGDVVKTRIMNQPTDSMGRGTLYRSSVDCLVKTVRKEGVMALYKGFIPIWSRMAPWYIVFWMSYEKLLQAAGSQSF
uniref:Mitochondrial uncoupling protein 4 n=1 Tax=Branchiostoma floridae TaxID=7739 RepID=C3YC96_BRAFL|eukprot:XP_002606118.1 hypothetical protein BRAFLDRAFT_125117 [Branchiostoma floridae]